MVFLYIQMKISSYYLQLFDSSILPELLHMTNEDPYFRYVSDEHHYYIEEKTPFIHELEQQVTMTSVEEPNLLQKIDDTIFPE